jgi:hypothetical protein
MASFDFGPFSRRHKKEPDRKLKLTEKIALVMRSTAGIGFAIAKSLAIQADDSESVARRRVTTSQLILDGKRGDHNYLFPALMHAIWHLSSITTCCRKNLYPSTII